MCARDHRLLGDYGDVKGKDLLWTCKLELQTWRKASPGTRKGKAALGRKQHEEVVWRWYPSVGNSRPPERSMCVLHTRVPYQMLPGLHDDCI